MGEFEEKLNSILGNQDAMGQIMALARSLSGDGGGQEKPPSDASSGSEEFSDGCREDRPSTPAMPDLSALFGQIDPAMIQMAMGVFQQYQSGDDRNTALLEALRPFLKEDRQASLDRAIQIARVSRLIRAALGAMGGKGEDGHV